MTTITLEPSAVSSPTLSLGSAPELSLVLTAALAGAVPEPDGLLLAGGEVFPGHVLDRVPLHGRPVGLIVVAADVGLGAATLARLTALVRQRGGLPVGPGICVDTADLADVTALARLALLGRRVAAFARNRRILRAT